MKHPSFSLVLSLGSLPPGPYHGKSLEEAAKGRQTDCKGRRGYAANGSGVIQECAGTRGSIGKQTIKYGWGSDGDAGELCGAVSVPAKHHDRGAGKAGTANRVGLTRDACAPTSATLPSLTDGVVRSSSSPASPEAGQLSQSTRPPALNEPAKRSPRKRAVHSRTVNLFGSSN